jgi:hypothetical protein|tara:strand:- start:3635 stop:4114 length:480 start_codon:yes stop_codon:yes gene_type:complete
MSLVEIKTIHAGIKEMDVRIKNLEKQSTRALRQGFFAFGKDLVNTSRELILKPPKTGRLYRVAGRKRRHRASAAGQAPANMTGRLRGSIDYKVQGAYRMEFGSNPAKNGNTAKTSKYAKVLEDGSGRIARRPYLQPSMKKNERNGAKHFERELRKAMSK